MKIENSFHHSITALARVFGGRFRTKNAMQPILWLNGIVLGSSLPVFIFSSNPMAVILFCILDPLVLIAAIVSYFWFQWKDPERLHSEEFVLRQQMLNLIEEKGSKKAIDAAMVPAITNKQFLQVDDASAAEPEEPEKTEPPSEEREEQ